VAFYLFRAGTELKFTGQGSNTIEVCVELSLRLHEAPKRGQEETR
jgi:hypothetical protein